MISPALPGLEDLALPDVDRPAAIDMTDGSRYTAANVIRDYPQVAQAVARALFFHRLTIRSVADIFRMSRATVAAIRDRVLAESAASPAAAFFCKTRLRSQRDIVLSRLMDELADRLESGDLGDVTIKELVDVVAKLEQARPATNGTEARPAQDQATQVIDAEEFDAAINGLDCGEKRALGGGGVGGGDLGSGAASSGSGAALGEEVAR